MNTKPFSLPAAHDDGLFTWWMTALKWEVDFAADPWAAVIGLLMLALCAVYVVRHVRIPSTRI